MTLAAILFAVFVAATLMPELLATWLGHSERAWEFVLRGVESMALIGAVAALALPRCRRKTERAAIAVALAYGAFDAIQRPICRLALPMDRPPRLENGQYLCDAAGVPTSGLAILLAAIAAFAIACSFRGAK